MKICHLLYVASDWVLGPCYIFAMIWLTWAFVLRSPFVIHALQNGSLT